MSQIDTTALHSFLTRLIQPVARVLLRHGISFRELVEVCRRAYVRVATDEFGVDGRPTNVSRVAMLTGMARRDVRNVRLKLDQAEQQTFVHMNSATRLLSGWYQDADFHDKKGDPLPLARTGKHPSFETLAKRYAGDIPATTLLKDLKKAHAVNEDDGGLLVVRTRYYMPGAETPATAETLLRSGSVIEDLGNTVDYNLGRQADDRSRFERRATNFRISEQSVDEFHAFVEKEGQAFLERIDSWLSAHEVSEGELDKHKTVRLGLGTYWIQGPVDKGALR